MCQCITPLSLKSDFLGGRGQMDGEGSRESYRWNKRKNNVTESFLIIVLFSCLASIRLSFVPIKKVSALHLAHYFVNFSTSSRSKLTVAKHLARTFIQRVGKATGVTYLPPWLKPLAKPLCGTQPNAST